MATDLYAEIKETSKYAGQEYQAIRAGQYPFPVTIAHDEKEYVIEGGPGARYRLEDVILFAGMNGSYVKIKD